MQVHNEGNPKPVLPHNIEAEQQLLGALLTNNQLFDRVIGQLKPETFYDPVHSRMYDAMLSRNVAGGLVSPVTMKTVLENDAGLKELGGPAYLARLAGSSISAFAISDYVSIIADLHAKRVMIETMDMTREFIDDGKKSSAEIAADLETKIGSVLSSASVKSLIKPYGESIIKSLENIQRIYSGESLGGLSTGISQLDEKIGYFQDGEFILLAGRPSMGKTTAAQNFAFSAIQQGHGVYYGSLEMTGDQMAPRFISRGLADDGLILPYKAISEAKITEAEFRRVIEMGEKQSKWPLIMGERDVREISAMRASIRRAKQKLEDQGTPLKLVIIDYLQLLMSNDFKATYDRVSAASDFCKSVAIEMGLPVVALSQLSRNVEHRDPPIPMLSDLRESGKLEEDADLVMFNYRDYYYLERQLEGVDMNDMDGQNEIRLAMAQCQNRIDYIVAKQRKGPTGTVKAYCDMKTCRVMSDRPVMEGELL